jgi:hypothetical protein
LLAACINTGFRSECVEAELVLAIGNGTGCLPLSIATEWSVLRSYGGEIDDRICGILPDRIALVGAAGLARVAIARSVALCFGGGRRELCPAVAIPIIDQASVFESIGLFKSFCTLTTCALNGVERFMLTLQVAVQVSTVIVLKTRLGLYCKDLGLSSLKHPT